MNCSMPGLPVHHQLLELTQTHVHWVSDAIQPSHPRLSPSPPVPNLSQHQSLFQWDNSSHEVAKVLELQLALASFLPKKSYGWSPSEWTGWISAAQGTLKSLLQHHSSKVSILQGSAFFTVQLSHPSSRWCHQTISFSVIPFFSRPQSSPVSESFQMSQLLVSKCWSFSFNISPTNEHPGLIAFRMDWLDLCSSRNSQESSPTPQFKSISSLALSLLCSPTLTSIHDHRKNHSLD